MDEKRILYILLSVIAGIYLLQLAWGFLGMFSDIFLILILSWLLAFILEPLVRKITVNGISRLFAAISIYVALAVLLVIFGLIIIPTIVTQLTVLAGILPPFFASAPEWAARFQTFLTSTLSNSVIIAQSVASVFLNLFLVLIISFYFLVEREAINKNISGIIPKTWRNEYRFLEKVINTSFAGFLRVQFALGTIVGFSTFAVLFILRVNYALSASVAAGILALVPVVGPALAILPPLLPAAMISLNTALITLLVLFLLQQIIFNVISPKILGDTLKLHPVLILLSFIVGYKIAGTWGAVFAVPATSVIFLIGKEFLVHWQRESQ